jgi:hypothetical protein
LRLTAADGRKLGKRKRFVFHGYFSLLLSLTILTAALIWVIYGDLPSQYYLPVSLGVIVVIGFLAFYILDKKIQF